MLAATSAPTFYQQWKDPAIQKCVAAVHKAYPSDKVTPPVNPTSPGAGAATDTTYMSVIEACQYLALFDDIAAEAGKNLTVASFTKAGYALKNADIPGIGAVSFGPGQAYAMGRSPSSSTTPRARHSFLRQAPGRNDPGRHHRHVSPHVDAAAPGGGARPRRSGLR